MTFRHLLFAHDIPRRSGCVLRPHYLMNGFYPKCVGAVARARDGEGEGAVLRPLPGPPLLPTPVEARY